MPFNHVMMLCNQNKNNDLCSISLVTIFLPSPNYVFIKHEKNRFPARGRNYVIFTEKFEKRVLLFRIGKLRKNYLVDTVKSFRTINGYWERSHSIHYAIYS